MISSRTLLRAPKAVAAPRVFTQAVRNYAAPAADSKPPVALYGVDGTYASALVCLFSAWALGMRGGGCGRGGRGRWERWGETAEVEGGTGRGEGRIIDGGDLYALAFTNKP